MDSILELAIEELDKGNFDQGKLILESILKKDPNHTDALYNLGVCLSEIGMFQDSIEALEKCITIKPDYTNAYVALGFTYTKIGNLELASSAVEKAVKLEPNNFYALRNAGAILSKLGLLDRALTMMYLANRIKPDSTEVLLGLAMVNERKKDYVEASKWYKRILEVDASEFMKQSAEEGLTRIAMTELKSKGPRMDAVMYMVGALEKFAGMEMTEIKKITYEIGMLGQQGFDINDPLKMHQLDILQGKFTGLQLVCTMYVGFKQINPSAPPVADLAEEYKAALEIYRKEQN